MAETEIGGEGRAFRSTLWTVVLLARDPGAAERREALESLIRAYWKPVYFFIRRKGNDSEASKDLSQGFFTALLEKNYLQYVRRERGRFRTFLLTALSHYLADEHDRASALKRGGGTGLLSLDLSGAESQFSRETAAGEAPDRAFRRDWALRVLAQALADLRTAYAAEGKGAEFDAVRAHLSPGADEKLPAAEIGRLLRVGEAEARKRVHLARGRYREAIRDLVRSYSETEEDVREELADLFAAFS